MQYVLTFTFVQQHELDIIEQGLPPVSTAPDFDAQIISEIEICIKAMIESRGQKYIGVSSELTNRSRVNATDLSPGDTSQRYTCNFVDNNSAHVHVDQLHNSFRFRYLHVLYEGDEIAGGFLTLKECMDINKISMRVNCATVNYGRGDSGELATLQLGYAVYEAISMLVAYSRRNFPVFILPFHPLEHFWKRANGDLTSALIEFDEWYERFRALDKILRNIGLQHNVIIGHRNWLVSPPSMQELENYCASKVLDSYLKSEVNFEEKPKEDSDLCHIISVEGAFNELLVTVINWYQRGNITNTELYYEISGKTPLEVVYAFCEKYNIEAKSEVKMIEDMSSDNFDSIESNIQRSLIF
tara:strand:+ start:12661 stop:13728 length:1068 start_codon:yes stop_codon:yes gene_type:complete